jgi:hypothetical protein
MVAKKFGSQKEHVQVLGLEDKKQVAMVVSSSTAKDLFPP